MAQLMMEELLCAQAESRLSEIFDEVIHRKYLIAVRRECDAEEVMYLLPREVLDAVVGAVGVEVDYLPDEAGMGLWVNDLEIGAHSATVEAARQNLVHEVRAYLANFLGQLNVYLTRPDQKRLIPQVLRLAIARSDDELARLLFDPIKLYAAHNTPAA